MWTDMIMCEKKPMQVTQLPCWWLFLHAPMTSYDTHLRPNFIMIRIQHDDPFILQYQSSRHMSQIETMKWLHCEPLPLHLPCFVLLACLWHGPRTPGKSVHGRESQGCRAALANSGSEASMHITPFWNIKCFEHLQARCLKHGLKYLEEHFVKLLWMQIEHGLALQY